MDVVTVELGPGRRFLAVGIAVAIVAVAGAALVSLTGGDGPGVEPPPGSTPASPAEGACGGIDVAGAGVQPLPAPEGSRARVTVPGRPEAIVSVPARRMDLRGEATEGILLPHGPGLLWLRLNGVTARGPTGLPSPCQSFEVAVLDGPAGREGTRALAVDVATSLSFDGDS